MGFYYQVRYASTYPDIISASSNTVRLVTSRNDRFPDYKAVQNHAYFSEVNWADLRQKEPPFVPELDSETDAGYFDDFSNEADMAKYKEVHDKQVALENMADRNEKMNKAAFLGFTFKYVYHGASTCLLLISSPADIKRWPAWKI